MNNNEYMLFKWLLIVGAMMLGFIGCGEFDKTAPSEIVKEPTVGITVSATSTETREASKGSSEAITSTANLSKTLEMSETGVISTLHFMAIGQYIKHIQVWQISTNDWHFSKQYELTRTLTSPVSIQVPPGQTATQIFRLVPTTTPVEEIFNRHYLSEVSLAATGQALGVVEIMLHCIERSTICSGFTGLYMFNSKTGKENILVNIPSHFEDGKMWLRDIYLSPDAQYLAVRDISNRPIVMNIEQEETVNLPDTTDVYGVLGWSPDSETVVFKLGLGHFTAPLKGFRLCSVISKKCQDIELENLWIGGLIDWHPTESKFAFSASTTNLTSESCYDLGVYIAETEAGENKIHALPVELSVSQPRWSPDGKYIAAWKRKKTKKYMFNCYSQYYLGTNSIVVLDAASGKLIQEIEGDDVQYKRDAQRPPQWQWGDNHTILVHGTEGMKVVDIENNHSQVIPYPPEMEWLKKVWYKLERQ